MSVCSLNGLIDLRQRRRIQDSQRRKITLEPIFFLHEGKYKNFEFLNMGLRHTRWYEETQMFLTPPAHIIIGQLLEPLEELRTHKFVSSAIEHPQQN